MLPTFTRPSRLDTSSSIQKEGGNNISSEFSKSNRKLKPRIYELTSVSLYPLSCDKKSEEMSFEKWSYYCANRNSRDFAYKPCNWVSLYPFYSDKKSDEMSFRKNLSWHVTRCCNKLSLLLKLLIFAKRRWVVMLSKRFLLHFKTCLTCKK